MAVSVYTGASSSDIVYINYTGDTPTKDNITNMTEVVAAYNAGKVIAIMAVANYETSTSSKVPFFLTQATNDNGAIYVFYFIADYVSGTGDNIAISCPYCIQIQCSQTQTSSGYIYTVSSVTDYGLTKAFPAAHADTHKTGGDDLIAPSDIGAQPKITANGILKGDGTGAITAAEETEVELVELTADSIGASPKSRILNITLPTASWTGSGPYTQTVAISGGTANTKVDIMINDTVYQQMVDDQVGYLAIANNSGTFTATASGGKPSVDLSIQVECKEVTPPLNN